MKDKDDKHNFKTITENDKQYVQRCGNLITVTIETLCVRDATNKSYWLADNNITQVFFNKWSMPTIQRVCTNYRGQVKLKGLILKLSEGHELTEAWPASWGHHCVSQSTVNIHQADKDCTLSALTTYGLSVLVVLFCFSRIYREERLANCVLCDTSKNFMFYMKY